MQYLPLFFDLKNRQVLLIGGGDVALRKARLLIRASAKVKVVSHKITPDLKKLIEDSHGEIIVGDYEPSLLKNVQLVIAATDNDFLNKQVYEDATSLQIPVNVVDNQPLCTFIFPAIVDRSPIVIGISSAGKAPVLARNLRAKIESIVPSKYADLGQIIGKYRESVKNKFNTVGLRRNFWEKVLEGPFFEQVLAGQLKEAEALLVETLEDANLSLKGNISFVSTGTGDPENITFKALRLMQKADWIVYDESVPDAIIELCRRDADLLIVDTSEDTNKLIELATNGQQVVRLIPGNAAQNKSVAAQLTTILEAQISSQIIPGVPEHQRN
jgi:uroporphyrin-III C-methyltransferase/precorrin-2 dehydrogenase/sirohydrochlorin ferrochelatase